MSIGLLLLALTTAYPQSLKYKHYSLAEGLSHNVGYDIHQDQKGYIWFALDNGLTRFDGQKFKNFTVEDGLNGPFVITLNEDREGGIWAGIHNEGVNYVRQDSTYKLNVPRTFLDAKTYHHKSGDFLIHEYVLPVGSKISQNQILVHTNGTPIDSVRWLYMYAQEGQLTWKDLGSFPKLADFSEKYYVLYSQDTSHLNLKVRQLSKGEIIILGPMGVFTYDPEKLFLPFSPQLLPKLHFKELDEDFSGNLWFLSDTELYCLSKAGTLEKFSVPENLKNAIQFKVIGRNKIFFLSENRDQLWIWNLLTGEQREVAADFNLLTDISFLEKDQELNLWFTTMGDGIFCIYDHGFNTFSKLQGLGSSYINSLRKDEDGSILVCTERGMDRISDGKITPVTWPKRVFPKNLTDKKDQKVKYKTQDVLSLGEGNYLLSTIGPTHFINPSKNVQKSLSSYFVRRFEPFSRDSIVLVTEVDGITEVDGLTENQINIIDLKTLRTDSIQAHIKHYSNFVTPYPDKDRKGYWINPQKGLLYLTQDTLHPYPLPQGLSQDEKIRHIIGGPTGDTWFSSEKGVLRHDGNTLTWFNKENNWPIFASRQILFDSQGNMWMASPNGLYCWAQDKLTLYTTYGADIRTLMIDSKNRLWIGTSLGVSYVELDNFRFTDEAPNLIIENIELDGAQIKRTELQAIASKQTLHIDYCALSFIQPEKIQYAYQLHDGALWQYTSNRSLDLTGLEIGEYQLKIKAKKFNSDWSKVQLIPFRVSPPWHRRWWAFLILGTLLLALVLLVSYFWGNYTKEKAEAKNQIAYEMGQLKLQALQSQLNPHFIFNALHVIQGYILKNDIGASNLYLSRFSHLMRRFLESSKKNEIALEGEIELLNLFVEMEQLCYKDKFSYTLNVAPELDAELIQVPSMLIQPFVENAIHHGLLKKEGRGALKISFTREKNRVRCLIEDDGIGRKKAEEIHRKSSLNHTSRGMQIVSERLNLHNQHNKIDISIDIADRISETGEKQGTQVEISWPISSRRTL